MKGIRILTWFLTNGLLIFWLTESGLSFGKESESGQNWIWENLPTEDFQNEPAGFRGLKWGEQPTEDMEFIGEVKGRVKWYVLPDEKLNIGNVQLTGIDYAFYDEPERFMAVYLHFDSKKDYEALEAICRGTFGMEIYEGFFSLHWLGKSTVINLIYNVITEESESPGWLFLASRAIFEEREKAREKELVEKAKEDW